MLSINDLHAGYGQGDVLFGVSFDVEPGGAVCLLGKNGAGKSTIMRSIMGLLTPSRGDIIFRNESTRRLTTDQIARSGIGYVAEDRRIFGKLSVDENLLVPRRSRDSTWTLDRVYQFFPILAERRAQLGGTLSGGEQQMLCIARALMTGPALLLLDEPSEGLAPLVVRQLAADVCRLRESGLTIVLAEQNMAFSRTVAERVYVIDKGTIEFAGSFDELERNPELKRAHLFVRHQKHAELGR